MSGRLSRARWREITGAAVAFVAVLTATTLIGPGIADAQSEGNGLDETSVNTFLFDAAEGVVRVTVDINLRNATTDRVDGNVIRQRYWDGYYLPVPLGAQNIVATSGGDVLSGELNSDPEFPAFSFYEFGLDRRLYSGQSMSIRVTYDHLGAAPREEVPWRVNAAYAAFVAFGIGDDGQVTINILRPSGYTFDEFTDLEGYVESAPDGFGSVTFTRAGVDETFETSVTMSNNDRLIATDVEVEGAEITLRSWPDDPEWTEFAVDRIESGVPALEELIGVEWPNDQPFDIRQSVEPYLYGYAGWYDPVENEIAIGEELDSDTMYHELAHAWFNSDLMTDLWLSEGFAQIYAAKLVSDTGEQPLEPTEPDLEAPGAQALVEWGFTRPTEEEEDFGYNASFWVMQEIADEIGFDGLRDVLEALMERRSPYALDPDSTSRASLNDWRRFLDLFELVGSSEQAGDLMEQFVVTDGDRADLEARDEAQVELGDLIDRSGSWGLPLAVQSAMDTWSFDRANEKIEAAHATLDRRDEVESLTTETGITPPDLGAETFADTTGSFDKLDAALDDQILDGQELADDIDRLNELASGIDITPPPANDEVFADRIDDFASASVVVTDQIDAVEQLTTAIELADADQGLVERIGLIGADVDTSLDASRSAVEAGDSDTARRLSADATDTLDQAGDLGLRRILIAAAIALGVVGMFVIVVILRRRRAKAATRASTIDSAPAATGDQDSENESSGSGRLDAEHDLLVGDDTGAHIGLDEDALAGAHLGSVNDAGDVAVGHEGQAAGSAGVVQSASGFSDVGDPVLELHENVVAVIDADSVTGTEVLIDPDSQHGDER